ncbi:MAG: phosphoenolpyruvate--protein phosphotransferase [Bacillota bacterium]|nr:phosphoenolpyruvate--protein phosphotransferase [Bacillota bacterium]
MKKGIAASKGYAIGKVVLKNEDEICITETKIENIEAEKKRLRRSVELSKEQILKIKQKTEDQIGKDKAEVFESHIMLLEDPEFIGAVEENMTINKINAEKSLKDIIERYVLIFESMNDEYMKERAADVKDVGKRILMNILGYASYQPNFEVLESNSVIVASELTPSDTACLDKEKVSAFLTDLGGRNSHSAIMARSLGIPAVVGLEDITSLVKDGDLVIVDGIKGEVIINPSDELIKVYEENKRNYLYDLKKLNKFIKKEAVTKDGIKIEILGNIGKPEEAEIILKNGGMGIGLFRTEFLYMDRDEMPSEEEQFESYRDVTVNMKGKPVIIRTLDIGGDKKLTYLPMIEESNPFLGYRAIRICLERKDIFKMQLRALLRASVFGNLKIMFPMIATLDEFLQGKYILEECMNELRLEGKAFNEKIEVGMMVEIPSAALMADEFAKYVDFFSIGTNDLIQYTLAADRMNSKVSYLYDCMNPAVLKLIEMVINAAHKNGKWCGMCGEMAGNEEAIPILLKLGLDEFSMSPTAILKAKQTIFDN